MSDDGSFWAGLADWARPGPPIPGVVYRHFDADGVLLYVGSTDRQQLRSRQRDHIRMARWWRFVARIEHELAEPDRRAAYLAEAEAIRKGQPIFNRFPSRFCLAEEERERRYLRKHSNTVARWDIASRRPPSTRRDEWTAQVNAMLDEMGLAGPSKPAPPKPPPDPQQLALFA